MLFSKEFNQKFKNLIGGEIVTQNCIHYLLFALKLMAIELRQVFVWKRGV